MVLSHSLTMEAFFHNKNIYANMFYPIIVCMYFKINALMLFIIGIKRDYGVHKFSEGPIGRIQ